MFLIKTSKSLLESCMVYICVDSIYDQYKISNRLIYNITVLRNVVFSDHYYMFCQKIKSNLVHDLVNMIHF